MSKKPAMTSLDEQRAVVKATLSAASVDDCFSPTLIAAFDKLAEGIYESTKFAFEFGEPLECLKGMQSLNNLLETITVLLHERNKKEK